MELIPQKPLSKDQAFEGPRNAFPLCSWVYHVKLAVIEEVMLLGFELDLYQLYEYALIYGYFP